MLDGHIHLERGEYTLEWIERFVTQGLAQGLDELWFVEHCYRFAEFVPMYDPICAANGYVDQWLHKKSGVLRLDDYLRLMDKVRQHPFPIKLKFGLEVCYFKGAEDFVASVTKDKCFDFLVGSVHFVDDFAFDHKAEHWDNVNVDRVYRRYFESSLELIRCGLYDGIAHPDCIKLFGHTPTFGLSADYEQMAQALAVQNMHAEQSSGIFRRCPGTAELGMNKELLGCMKKHHVRLVTVSDAHCPEDVGADILVLSELIDKA